ncbi:MAG TPA: M20/M25/M40 family metallo-hydrolase [Candidatus Eisenbacteria bacterium]|nr:M20/M25/M40 family metallo-hydrolase [Candidatus Eisenbacteria bacterium]
MSLGPLDRSSVLAVLSDLVRIPSVNPALAPEEAHGESAVATFARDWLLARGIDARLEEAAPGRPNAVASVGSGEGPTLVFCAHLDTVGTAGMTIPPFEPRVEGDRVYGRGSFDMKGGVAAILAAAHAIALSPPKRGKLLLALVCDEEYASLGADDFVRRHRADGCVLTEGSEGKLIVAHKGFAWIEVRTEGRAAHGSRWDLGVSAISRMGRIAAALDEFDRAELRARTHPLVGPASLHCSRIEGGVGLSTYAPECTLQVERRTLPGETAEQAVREIQEVVRRAGEDAAVTCVFSRAPLSQESASTIVRAARQGIRRVTGADAEEAGVGYWMDAAVFAAAGIPAVDFGPRGVGAHEAVEWVSLDSVVECAQVLVETARSFLEAAPASSRD